MLTLALTHALTHVHAPTYSPGSQAHVLMSLPEAYS